MLVFAFLLGSGQTLFDSAAQAALPAVVPGPLLERANGRLYAGMLVAGGFAGPPLGGVLFAAAAAVPFGVDAASPAFRMIGDALTGQNRRLPADRQQVAPRVRLTAPVASALVACAGG